MAYTIVKSDGTVLTTIPDGTINTTSTSLGLPGRNYAGYGQVQDTNFVHMVENFAAPTPPPNPLKGQLWFNTNSSTLYVCPSDGESNALAWLALTSTSSGGTTSFGNVAVIGDISANNITATNDIIANSFTGSYLTISANAVLANAHLTGTTTIDSLYTTFISTDIGGNTARPGLMEGTWTINGTAGTNGNALILNTGGLYVANTNGRIVCDQDRFFNTSGEPILFGGNYGNADVAAYLPTYNGNVLTVQTQATVLTTGANTTPGNITGNWTLTAGSRINGISVTAANITGVVANANYANTAGTVVIAAQPNITSVGTLTSLVVSGNVSASRMSLTAGQGTAPLAVTSTTKVDNLNADLLDGMDAVASVATGNSVVARDSNGNITGNYIFGNGAFLTGISAGGATSSIANGSSTVNIPASGGNVNISVGGFANVLIVGTNFARVLGTMTANTFSGNASGLFSVPGANVSGAVPTATQALSVAGANVSGTVANATFATNAGTAFSVSGSNVSGTVANAAFATNAGTAYSVSGGNVSGTVANATYATSAGSASSVPGSGVTGTVANATFATSAGSATNATNATNASNVPWTGVSGRPTDLGQFTNNPGYITRSFPAGTRMLFAQTNAPTGWTKVTTTNDAALRVVSGTAGSGGTLGFNAVFASQSVSGTVGGTALTIDQIPAHYHNTIKDDSDKCFPYGYDSYFGTSGGPDNNNNNPYYVGRSSVVGGGQAHTHTFSAPAINLGVKYVDVIIASKD